MIRPGDAATFRIGGDRYPCTVKHVSKTGAKLVVTLDQVRAGYLFTQSDEPLVAYRNAAGQYITKGHGHISIGQRRYALDPSF